MRKLCFGGSFNPIHHGHLICARAVAESRNFDRVILIPSGQPPHKSEFTDMAPASDRLAMCRAAVQNDPLFQVCDIEITRAGPSYTLLTARDLKASGEQEIFWLLGADMALTLPTWHQSVTLLTEVNFLIMARPGSLLSFTALPPPFQKLADNIVTAPEIDISSTQIRRRIKDNLPIDYFAPKSVIDYIAQHALYQRPAPATP